MAVALQILHKDRFDVKTCKTKEGAMTETKRLWIFLGAVVFGTLFLLGWFGRELYRQVPPIPLEVRTEAGEILMTKADILRGQQAWQSIGGQQVGSIWGHGAYQAPDWSADWLHREAVVLQERLSLKYHDQPFEKLPAPQQAEVGQRLKMQMRRNTYDPERGRVTLSEERAAAIAATADHYLRLFGNDPKLADLRESYALHENALPENARREALTAFFFWTAWAATTEREGMSVTYTNNWPHEPLVGNLATTASLVWSLVSIALLLAGIGGLVWYKLFRDREEAAPTPDPVDPLNRIEITPSMRATAKYAVTVIALFVVQALLGGLVAHYTVEGDAFFGLALSNILPYAVARTWHVQLAVFWIATAFLAAGLFLAPAVGGTEPKYQRLGVNALFSALLLVVTGSLLGEWLSVQQVFSLDASFWFGHQGYEYVDLGRFWQILLFIGLLLWLVLMLRGLWPALKAPGHRRQLVLLFAGSSAAIGLFYGAGFFYGAKTHLTIMEYWRWWVVHLWVEGFFEVFATAAIAFIFTRLGLVRALSATRAVLFSSAIYLFGGIPGTFHHLYFSGTPISIMAVGATFSALEVVPLALIGYEAWETYQKSKLAAWMAAYRWPICFFMGVAFWNLVGAGVFGFLINPPIALYYMQGLNTTPVHAHAALFGVYGLLALGLVLVVLRRLYPEAVWREGALSLAFWSMNGGLALMIVLSLLPIGLMQTWASIEHGLWYARSAEYLQQPFMEVFRWLRTIGDTVFLVGVAALVYFVIGLIKDRSPKRIEPNWRQRIDSATRKQPA
jgi:nitric oxide reductase subunit B